MICTKTPTEIFEEIHGEISRGVSALISRDISGGILQVMIRDLPEGTSGGFPGAIFPKLRLRLRCSYTLSEPNFPTESGQILLLVPLLLL